MIDTTEYQELACLFISRGRTLRSTVDELVRLAYEAGMNAEKKTGPAEAPASPGSNGQSGLSG